MKFFGEKNLFLFKALTKNEKYFHKIRIKFLLCLLILIVVKKKMAHQKGVQSFILAFLTKKASEMAYQKGVKYLINKNENNHSSEWMK